MASMKLVVLLLAVTFASVQAIDGPLPADFGINVTSADQLVFKNVTGKVQAGSNADGVNFPVNVAAFPALKGQGGSMSIVEYEPGVENLPHWHPRATEFMYVLEGTLEIAVIDTMNRKFENVLNAGDFTFFPQGLFHYQRNIGETRARAIFFFNSENPGTAQAVRQLFLFKNDDIKPALAVDDTTLDYLRAGRVAQRSPARFNATNADVLGKCLNQTAPQGGPQGPGARKML